MKCPVCGSPNKDTQTACFRCGQPLKRPKKQRDLAEPKKIWDKPVAPPPPKDFAALDDEVAETFHAPDLLDEGVPIPENVEKIKNMRSGEEIMVVIPPNRKRKRPAPQKTRRFRIRWGRFALSLVLIAAVCTGIGYGTVLIYRKAVGGLSDSLSKAAQDSQMSMDPVVEKVLLEGSIFHRITFFGADNDIIMVDEPRRSLTIENGQAQLLLDDASFLQGDIASDLDVLQINLNATLFDSTGAETPVHVAPYAITVPLSPLKLVSPQIQSFQTNEDRVVVNIRVTPGSRVLIDDKNVTDKVGKDGHVSASVAVEAKGINVIPITVETPLHRVNRYELRIDRPIMTVPITLHDTVAQTSETRDSTITISGGTEPGAVITTNAKVNGEITTNTETGSFEFVAQLQNYGWNKIEITATTPSGNSSTMVHQVMRTPDLDSYSKRAWPMDYDYLSSATKALIGQVFVFKAQIVRKVEDDAGDYYLANVVADDSVTRFLVIENTRDTELEIDRVYRMYADVTGTHNDYPLLVARFIYEDTQAAPTATPEAQE